VTWHPVGEVAQTDGGDGGIHNVNLSYWLIINFNVTINLNLNKYLKNKFSSPL